MLPRKLRVFAPWRRRSSGTPRKQGLRDEIELRLNGLLIRLLRDMGFNWPHEVHIVVPRAEFIRAFQNGRLVEERTILSSISIVHAPKHPPAEGSEAPFSGDPPPRGYS